MIIRMNPALMMQKIPIRQIACGYVHTVILEENNDVFVVGHNYVGQLGLGHNRDQNEPIRLMGEISQIACGYCHTILVNCNNNVLVFGSNLYGQLGLNDGNDNYNKPVVLMQEISIRQIACGGNYSIILTDNNNVLVFGYNHFGQLGLGHNDPQYEPIILMKDKPIHQIACGDDHAIILTDDNEVFGFGDN